MAAQVDGSSTEYSAETVGHAFVAQFYHILHSSPELVHRFFKDTSTMSRPGPDGMLRTVTALQGVNDLILSLDCQDYKAEILTADAQASHMNGVIVLVTGCLAGKDNVRRKFAEFFFLAPQDQGYYVLNNAFRFVEEDGLPVVNSVGEKDFDISAPVSPSTVVPEKVEVPDNSVQNHTAVSEVTIVDNEEIDASKDDGKSTVKETAAVTQPPIEPRHNEQPVVEASSNGHVDAPKKSYASLLRNMKEGASITLVRAAASPVKAVPPNTAQQPVATPPRQQSREADAVPATASDSSVSNGSNNTASTDDQVDGKGHSVYIGDLPWDATTELVEQEFKEFGRIKRNGIQVRSNKGYCFGFVEYEDATGMRKALEMGTIRIAGKEAFIQEKKTTTRVVNGVSTFPSGRGGFRNDGFRGRGGYSNGRGYPRNDYGKHSNGEVPFRGHNRSGSREGYQNSRGRGGARQGSAPE